MWGKGRGQWEPQHRLWSSIWESGRPSSGYVRRREFQVYLSSGYVWARDVGKRKLDAWGGFGTPVSLPQCPLCPRSISGQDSDPEFHRGLEPRPQGCSQATAGHSRGQGPPGPRHSQSKAVPLPSPPLASWEGSTAHLWPAAESQGRWTVHSPPLASRGRKCNPSLASNEQESRTERAQPTLGGRRGPRSPAGARSAPPCCGGRCRGRCGSFSVGPAAPGSNRRGARRAGNLEDRSLEVAAALAFQVNRSRNRAASPRRSQLGLKGAEPHS